MIRQLILVQFTGGLLSGTDKDASGHINSSFLRKNNYSKILPLNYMILKGKCPKIFYWNKFRRLPIDMVHIDRFSYKIIHG
ncbi:hypothetical protein BTF08_09725 [Salmonella enterica]|nr:hypothetical protein [Salmonella enterica]EDX4410279.1 hypothetical protein [Salmonella enterica subsp. houtenae serovar 44:z36,[z38]:-]HAC6490456.1 hypothetical protein [Salmonella enterica subsp. houtenae serovar 44:z36[z38]:-]EAY1799380.1 hypothetical protein [Salmonella enterica]EAY1902158.1 hypothetical protein [Salmonella enterica]